MAFHWCLEETCLRSVKHFTTVAELEAHKEAVHGIRSAGSVGSAVEAGLADLGLVARGEPYAKLDVERPVGHTTHNLFVKCKKTSTLYLITHHQAAKANLVDIAKAVGAKNLRLASSETVKSVFGDHKGCITSLTLLKDTECAVAWVLDEALRTEKSLTICSGCSDPLDHSQHRVVDLTPQQLLTLTEKSGHTPVFVEFR